MKTYREIIEGNSSKKLAAAWEKGKECATNGKTANDNPYKDKDEKFAWKQGWEDKKFPSEKRRFNPYK